MAITGDYHDQTALINFDTTLHHQFYQTKFRSEPVVERRPLAPGNKGLKTRINRSHSEGLFVPETQRFSVIVPTHSTKYDARWVSTTMKHAVEFVDEKDIQEVLMDPKGEIQANMLRRLNRTWDVDCVNAMFAPVEVGGMEGQTEFLSFAADGGTTIDMTAGATYEKLLEIKETLIDREVINEGPIKLYMTIDGTMNTQFLNELELTSGDYTTANNAETGEIQTAVGITFIRYGSGSDVPDPILPVAGGVRTGYCAATGAMKFVIQDELETIVDKDPTRHHTWRIMTYMRYGFLRMDARKILKVTTTAA